MKYKINQKLDNCTYIKEVEVEQGNRMVLLLCPCGNTFTAQRQLLPYRLLKSCGCILETESYKIYRGKDYNRWYAAMSRCYNPNLLAYKSWGGRGIGMYEPWRTDSMAFIDYIRSLPKYGEEGLSLDRINNDGDYEPGNLRWATAKEQVHNSRCVLDVGKRKAQRDKAKGKIRELIIKSRSRRQLYSLQSVRSVNNN